MRRVAATGVRPPSRRLERFGVEPIPAELRTHGALDLFRIMFSGNVNPVMMVLGALTVSVGRLPFWWAVAAMSLGQALGALCLVAAARVGVDYGLPGQVGLRATFGLFGARSLTSPYRIAVSTYWFAAQALGGALALHAVIRGITGQGVSIVAMALALGGGQALLAMVGFHALRRLARITLPMGIVFIGAVVLAYATSGDPAFAFSNVAASPGLSPTWAGFAAFVSIFWAATASNVTNVADLCRYTRSRRAMRLGVLLGSTSSALAATSLGAYAAVAAGVPDPFRALAEGTQATVGLAVLGVAALAQSTSINVMNLYTAGLSLTNSLPAVGRVAATALVGVFAVALGALPSVVTEADRWVQYLGALSTPIAGVIIADRVLRRHPALDVPALFDPRGRYRFFHGVRVTAFVATAAGALAYAAVPDAWVKAAWGTGAAAAVLLALTRREAPAGQGQ